MNDTQKNFKKQMDQSLKELKSKDKDAYHKYVKRNHLDDAESREKEEKREKVVSILSAPFKIISKLIGVAIIIVIGYNFIKGTMNQTQSLAVNNNVPTMYSQSQIRTKNQQQIINYINFINPINNSIGKDINLRNKDLGDINKKLLTNSEYINNSTVYINRINNNITQITNASCPEVLELYKNILLDQYSSLVKAMSIEIQYINSGNVSLRNEITINIEQYNSKNQDAQKELNSILKDNKLK